MKKFLSILTLLLAVCSGAWGEITTKSDFSNGDIFILNKANVDAATWIEKGSSLTSTGSITPSKQPTQGADSEDGAGTKGDYYKLKKLSDNRQMTFKVSGISTMRLYAQASSTGRIVYATVDGGTEKTIISSFAASGTTYTGDIELDASTTHTIVVYGNNEFQLHAIKVFVASTDTESPSITTNLASSYTAYVGSPLNLSIVAAHANSYQWYSNTSATNSGGTAIVGATSATYSYTPAVGDLNTTKYFYCVATNSNATGTQTATSTCTAVSVEVQTLIGLQQIITGTTMAAATYTGITNVTVAEAHGSLSSINQGGRNVSGPNSTTYTADKVFRKEADNTDATKGWQDTKWVGYTITIADGYKVTLSNLKATLWDANSSATWKWRVRVLNSSNSILYTSDEQTTTTSAMADLSVANPTGLTDLVQGTYTVELQMYVNGGNKYFAVPYLTFDAEVEEYEATTFAVTTSVNDETMGSVTATAEYLEGANAVITATPNEGYKFVSWTVDATENASTTNPYTFSNITAAHTIQAVFAARKAITFNGYADYKGTRTDDFLHTEYADENDKFTAPANLYLSSDNKTLTGWNDGTNTYAVGAEIDLSDGSKELTPVFTANSAASLAAVLDARTAGFTTTWNFGSNYADFNVEQKTAYYVQQATINGASVDIPMFIDATKGKFNDTGDNTTRAQINGGTKLTIPVVDGSVVTLSGYHAFGTTDRNNNECTQTTINGVTSYDTSTNDGKTAIYTYSGDAGTIDIAIGGDMAWGYSLSVSYPSPYTVTYDGNGATSGSVTDTKTYDANATVTTQANGFEKTGFAFTGWNTEADGSGTDVAAGGTFTITDNTTLYAQWIKGTEATITYTLNVSSSENKNETTITSENVSTSENLNTLVGITNNTGGNLGTGDKANLTVKIPTDASYNEDHYMSVGFTVAEGYSFTPTSISVKAQPVSTDKDVKIVLTDGTNTIEKTQTGAKQGVISTITATNEDATAFTGDVTLKIYCYGDDNTYRLGSPITISGAVVEAPITLTPAKTYTTLTSAKALDFTGTGLTAFIVKDNDLSDGYVTMTEVQKVPANTGLVIKAEEPGTAVNVPILTDTADDVEGNLMEGSATEETEIAANGGYILSDGEFHPSSGNGKLAAGKAYLHIAVSSARVLRMKFNDETTGIGASLMNSETVNSEVYNLNGQRVAQPTKGLYIVGGRKVVVK